MKTIEETETVTLYVTARPVTWNDKGYYLNTNLYEPHADQVCIKELVVEIPIEAGHELTPELIAALETKKEALLTTYMEEVQEVDSEIANLRCLDAPTIDLDVAPTNDDVPF